jgi:hypothetical protein
MSSQKPKHTLPASFWGKSRVNKYGVLIRYNRPFADERLEWGDDIEFVFLPDWVEDDVEPNQEHVMKYSEEMVFRWPEFISSPEWEPFMHYCFDDINWGSKWSQSDWNLMDRKVFTSNIDGDLAIRITGTLMKDITKRQPIPSVLTEELYSYWEDAFFKSTSEGELYFDRKHQYRLVMGVSTRMWIRKI